MAGSPRRSLKDVITSSTASFEVGALIGETVTMGKFIKIAGYVFLAAGGLLILTGYVGIYMKEGFSGLQEVLSPFNVQNLIAVAITLAPGGALVWLGDYLMERRERLVQ